MTTGKEMDELLSVFEDKDEEEDKMTNWRCT